MALISITRLRVRSWRYLPMFFVQAARSQLQARAAEGCLGADVLREAHRTFWTRSAWTSEAAMRAYMMSGVHKQVMRRLADWCDEASVVHWLQDTAERPDWKEAHARMQRDGRPSRVNHPTEAQRKFEVPPPRL
jgi:quinol monooxygenase YgiN